jgi:acetyl esterase/lipase
MSARPNDTHLIVLPGGGYATHVEHEAEPIVEWLGGLGVRAGVFRYPLAARHPEPLRALQAEIQRLRRSGAERIGLIGFSAGGHLAGLAALAPGADPDQAADFAVLGYAITSMETDTYRPARLILLGDDATPELRRATSLDALVTHSSPPFFLWHTAEDGYVPPEHTYRLAASLAANGVPHTVHPCLRPRPTQSRPGTGQRRRRGLDDARGFLDHRTKRKENRCLIQQRPRRTSTLKHSYSLPPTELSTPTAAQAPLMRPRW